MTRANKPTETQRDSNGSPPLAPRRRLKFEIREVGDDVVISVIDAKSGNIIRQIPQKTTLSSLIRQDGVEAGSLVDFYT